MSSLKPKGVFEFKVGHDPTGDCGQYEKCADYTFQMSLKNTVIESIHAVFKKNDSFTEKHCNTRAWSLFLVSCVRYRSVPYKIKCLHQRLVKYNET